MDWVDRVDGQFESARAPLMRLEPSQSEDNDPTRLISKRSTGREFPSWKIALLSVVTIGGGTNGVLSCFIWLANNRSNVREFVAVSFLSTLFALGIWSGVAWHIEKIRGVRLVKVFLAIQCPVLKSSIVSFKLWAVGSYSVIFQPQQMAIDAGWYLGSDWELALFHSVSDPAIGVNLLPLGLMSLLWGSHIWRPSIR